VYRWVVVLAPRGWMTQCQWPTANFGVFQSGEIKVRLLKLSGRANGSVNIIETQMAIIEILLKRRTRDGMKDVLPKATGLSVQKQISRCCG